MIGIDIVSIPRIERILQKDSKNRFLNRFLSPQEQQLTKDKASTIAGFFASKEAVSKALQCGIGDELSFFDITIKKTLKNAPFFELTPTVKKKFNIQKTSLSITHDGGFAIAVAVVL